MRLVVEPGKAGEQRAIPGPANTTVKNQTLVRKVLFVKNSDVYTAATIPAFGLHTPFYLLKSKRL